MNVERISKLRESCQVDGMALSIVFLESLLEHGMAFGVSTTDKNDSLDRG